MPKKRKVAPHTLEHLEPLEKLRVAEVVYNLHGKTAEITSLFPGSIGVKLFCLLRLNVYYPNLQLLKKSKETMPGRRLPVLCFLRHDALWKLCFRHEIDIKKAQGKELTDKEKSFAPVDEAEVATYFQDQFYVRNI